LQSSFAISYWIKPLKEVLKEKAGVCGQKDLQGVSKDLSRALAGYKGKPNRKLLKVFLLLRFVGSLGLA